MNHHVEPHAVVAHVQPVADVQPFAVQRHREAVDGVGGEQRNDLFRKLKRSVVVRRAGDDHGHLVGGPVAVRQPVCAGLRGRIGVPRFELVGLAARSLRHAAVHLVGGDLHEAAEPWRATGGLEQHEGADHVRSQELFGGHQRPVDVRLGREVDDDVGGFDQGGGHRGVRDVAVDERVPRVAHEIAQRLHAPGVRELVQVGDAPVGMLRQRVPDEVAADEAGAAGDEHVGHGRENGGQRPSRSESTGDAMGQAMPSAGSFHLIPDSCDGVYSAVML